MHVNAALMQVLCIKMNLVGISYLISYKLLSYEIPTKCSVLDSQEFLEFDQKKNTHINLTRLEFFFFIKAQMLLEICFR